MIFHLPLLLYTPVLRLRELWTLKYLYMYICYMCIRITEPKMQNSETDWTTVREFKVYWRHIKKIVLVTTELRARKAGRNFLTEADNNRSQMSRLPGRGRKQLQGAAVAPETTETNTECKTRTYQWWGTDVPRWWFDWQVKRRWGGGDRIRESCPETSRMRERGEENC